MNRADHRARVVASVARHGTRAARVPAGHYGLHAAYPWIVGAGAKLVCLYCNAQGTAPAPRLDPAGYTGACEAFLTRHQNCKPEPEPKREGACLFE